MVTLSCGVWRQKPEAENEVKKDAKEARRRGRFGDEYRNIRASECKGGVIKPALPESAAQIGLGNVQRWQCYRVSMPATLICCLPLHDP